MLALAPGEFLLRLLVAMLLGLGVGLEREFRSDTPRAAGMRTLALVEMGAALFTLISAYGFAAFSGSGYALTDPSRVAAQIVSGIGFLGAGAILLRRQAIRGLTTAAAIWATAAIGMAVGLGFYLEAIGATVIALAVLEALRPIESRLFPRQQQSRIRIRINPGVVADPLEEVRAMCEAKKLAPNRLTIQQNERGTLIELVFSTRTSSGLLQLSQQLRASPMVRAIRTDVVAPKGEVKLPSPRK